MYDGFFVEEKWFKYDVLKSGDDDECICEEGLL